jgi:hypothetical protein
VLSLVELERASVTGVKFSAWLQRIRAESEVTYAALLESRVTLLDRDTLHVEPPPLVRRACARPAVLGWLQSLAREVGAVLEP